MNSMKRHSISGILVSLLLVFSIFTLFSISEVNAEEVILVNAKSYENSVIIEFENNSESKIKTIRMWGGGEITFESFKSQLGWGGGKYSDGKMLIFTATNMLNPDESVKFGLVTSEKIDGMNWRALDQNGNDIDAGKASIGVISETNSSFIEEEGKEVEQAKETGSQLYGTKKFIPEQIRAGSDIRLVGNAFSPEENLKLYLDNTILKSIQTDKQGNFFTTISIPVTSNVGNSEFIIKDESENIQTTTINVKEAKNRIMKSELFDVKNIPTEIKYDETLTISGNAYPQTAVIISFEDKDRVLEKSRVITADSNGEWLFEEVITRDESIGDKYVIIKNNQDKTTKNLTIKSDFLIQINTSATRYNTGETISMTGNGVPGQDIILWIKNENGKIIHYNVISNADGNFNYNLVLDETFSTGTYAAIIKQGDSSDATLFGIGKYPTSNIVSLINERNFELNSRAILSIISPPSTNISITILDDNDNIKIQDSIKSSPSGKNKYTIDLDGYSSGIYRAVASTSNIQDSVKFSVGLEPGSGPISLITTKSVYSPGETITIIGSTGNDARLTVTLRDSSGNISSQTEIFSDSSGNFSTSEIGIPINGILGTWEITIHSRLDTKIFDVNVDVPISSGIVLEIDQTDFKLGDTITINGVAQSNANRLHVEIINESDEVIVTLTTPLASDGTFILPWIIPMDIDAGVYTIKADDGTNSDSFEIFIE